ncbi:hypothetical protein CDAR_533161 [Caerostris darwini]|uniref:Uncharacterized protein n=1 Tax=Caerostris darwini TaxID=1538125 RepID=A0AAV4QXQ2_9ARAC|nr:hypothetical protein CDAR_533161 [Caerostris darwini]
MNSEDLILRKVFQKQQLGRVLRYLRERYPRHCNYFVKLLSYAYEIETSVFVKGLLHPLETQIFIVYRSEQDAVTVQKWSPDERSIMSADGTVPKPPPPRWLSGVPRRYCK